MNLSFMDTGELLRKALSGEKLFPDEAIYLCEEGDLMGLALAGGAVTKRLHPEGKVGFAISQTILYSNVCQPSCPFCTGTVTREDAAAFTKSTEAVVAEAGEAVANGATQIVLQGGHRIDLPWEYYTGLVKAIKEAYPQVQIFAYSPTEIMVFNVVYQKKTAEVIGELKAAGMGGLFAGGAQTMNTRAPEYRALLRGPWNEWFDVVHRCADAGIPVVAPFVFGLGEAPKERVGHLYRVRAVQERTTLAKKPAFVSLAVFTLTPAAVTEEPASGDHVVHVEGEAVKVNPGAGRPAPVTGHEYLRMVALARVLVQSIAHVQTSFVSQGAKIAQVALDGGADDFGGTYLEYKQVELAAGRVGAMTPAEMERLITDTGRIPVLRTHW
jgi:cyclic dehypoxanthinyl futalosine synthase